MRKLFQKSIWVFLLLAGCREEYDPPVKSTEQSILVVEGVLNSGSGPTAISLSRTSKLEDSAQSRPESGAQLMVEGRDGDAFALTDPNGSGVYYNDQLLLNPAGTYRLHIYTQNGNEYVSDYVPVKKTPPIDTIAWQRTGSGVTIDVSTHDAANATRYYKWDFEETWQIRSAYYANFKVENGSVDIRDASESIYFCWRNQLSTGILLGSSARLQSDVISANRLLLIPPVSEKLGERYSILVKQNALDKAGYEFYELMKKNTESLGSLFDAQPSEVTGNIHSVTNPAEVVIGYVSASNTEEKRIFISKEEIGPDWGYRYTCLNRIIPNNPDSIRVFFPNQLLPYDGIYAGRTLVAFNAAEPACVDCRLRNGTTERPSFW